MTSLDSNDGNLIKSRNLPNSSNTGVKSFCSVARMVIKENIKDEEYHECLKYISYTELGSIEGDVHRFVLNHKYFVYSLKLQFLKLFDLIEEEIPRKLWFPQIDIRNNEGDVRFKLQCILGILKKSLKEQLIAQILKA